MTAPARLMMPFTIAVLKSRIKNLSNAGAGKL
jgi:hypothetical protein